ncbi:MAG: universal stress protein [Rhodothermales bacterium]
MLNVRNILVTTDLAEDSLWSIRYGWTLAARFGAELHVFYADVLHGPLHGASDTVRADTEVASRLDELTTRIADEDRDGSRVKVRYAIERDVYPAPAILDYADNQDVDLIVMGTHGRRGVSRLVLGSVAEEVVREAKCAVMTIRKPEGEVPDHVDMTSVLVPFDFSEHAEQALAHAKELAAAFGARIELLHVIEEQLHPAFYGITVQSIYDLDPDIEQKSVDHMKEAFESIAGPDVRVAYEARGGSPAREIADYADEIGASLIVMGTHGLTGLEHFLLGSTTERVLRRAKVPVLALKSLEKSLLDTPAGTQASTA